MLQSTFRQLEVFLRTIDLGSFARAAEEMNVSQPAISRHIKALELQCGMPLLMRNSGQKSELTPAGVIVYQRAQYLVAEAQSLSRELTALRSNRKPEPVRITGHPFVIEHIVRPRLGEFLAQHPDVALEFSGGVAEAFARRGAVTSCDVAFGVIYQADPRGGVEILRQVQCGLYAARGFTPSNGAPLPFVLPLEQSTFEQVMLRQIHDAGITNMTVTARAQHTYVIRDLVRRGVGVAFLPHELVSAEVASEQIVLLPLAVPDLQLAMVVADQARGRKPVKLIMDFARRCL